MDSGNTDPTFSKRGNKRIRTSISLEQKLDMIRRSELGERASTIAKTEHLPSSTVRSILGNSEKIKKISKLTSPKKTESLAPSTNPIMTEMEQKLTTWYEKESEQGTLVNLEKLQSKALDLYHELNKDDPNSQPFVANTEWFNRYRSRFHLTNFPSINSDIDIAAVNDTAAINDLGFKFRDLVQRNEYLPQQIFNVAETILFWKKMPATFTLGAEKYSEEPKDRFTLLMGGNAHGNFKLKPLLVYHLKNPQALKGYPKSKLPVIWKTNKKAQITQLLFSDWFTSHFCPAVEQYCRENNLANKALLILDKSAGYPTNLDDLSSNIKVLYLPSNNNPLLQSSNQAVFEIFRAHYLSRTLSQAVAIGELETADYLIDFWDTYDVKKAISNLSNAWNDVKAKTMNSAWKSLYPDCIRQCQEPAESIEDALQNIVDLMKQLSIENISKDDVQELLHSQNEQLTTSEILKLEKERAREEFMDEDDDILPIKALTIPILREAMEYLEVAMAIYKEHDPDSERSSTVCRNIENAVACYRQLYREKKKAFSLDKFLNHDEIINEQPNVFEGPSLQPQSTKNSYDLVFIKEEIDAPLSPAL